jgi:hypothetical protein
LVVAGFLLVLLLCNFAVTASAKGGRTLSGIIYFTNNTPENVEQFPVELFGRDQKHLVAATTPDQRHRFAFTDLKPGKYLLKFNWPNHCVLWYRVNLTKQSRSDIRVIMDAACAHADGSIQELPEN